MALHLVKPGRQRLTRGPLPRNSLLAALEATTRNGLLEAVETVSLRRGEVLSDSGQEVRKVYFPHGCVISLTVPAEDGSAAEAATVGREGMVGFTAAMGDRQAFTRNVVQIAGTASWLPLDRLAEAFEAGGATRDLCLRYAQTMLSQVLQSVVCGARHLAEQRLARWLLMLQDRAGGSELRLTQEFLAGMLCVRRATVAGIMRELGDAGIVRQGRGALEILDRRGLEGRSCECYRIVRDQYARLLPRTFA
jgi:CRP-like cAMP-binding protein